MLTYQLQAGSILDSIRELIEEHAIAPGEDIQKLLTSLSYFSVAVNPSRDLDSTKSRPSIPPIYQVAENIISRGLPTRPSLYVEKYVNELLTNSDIEVVEDKAAKEIGSIKHTIAADKDFAELLWRALHVIDPDASNLKPPVPPKVAFPPFGSDEEEVFFNSGLPNSAPKYLAQLIESEREIEQIVGSAKNTQELLQEYRNEDFIQQRVDFCLELPYSPKDAKGGYIFEIDGNQHNEDNQRRRDNKRDAALNSAGFEVIRIPANHVDSPYDYLETLRAAVEQDTSYLSALSKNIEQPLTANNLGKLALSAALVPFAVSRIEKLLCRLINTKKLDIEADEWHIAIIERDVECAQVAINDFTALLNALAELSGQKKLPKIILDCIPYEVADNTSIENDSRISPGTKYDLLIDTSLLSRNFADTGSLDVPSSVKCTMRSSCSIESTRHFIFAPNVTYLPLGKHAPKNGDDDFIENPEKVKSLEMLLTDIFRKSSFRPGQLKILDRALRNENVVGLLPTGHGKSLTYQLAAMLQPGVCAVIDPLKSLMRDQVRGLQNNRIDGCIYINSSLSTLERQAATEKLGSGEVIFAFIAPERLQSQEFRNTLLFAGLDKIISFSYGVIDEAHCVSEWGHDFRTSYLRIGENTRRFCKSWDREEVPIFALTATASYDVLADIQRELNVNTDSIITLKEDEMRREELTFRVVDIKLLADDRLRSDSMGYWDIIKTVASRKESILSDLLKATDLKQEPTIVFCPHKSGPFGVKDLKAHLFDTGKLDNWTCGQFTGGSGLNLDNAKDLEVANQKTQDGFMSGDVDILFATKAFGMGINKHNIRHIFHLNYPSSIEGYYQEAGRAGRDRKPSECIILFCDQNFDNLRKDESITLDSNLMFNFHESNFKGVDFEKRWLYELLQEIHHPKVDPLKKIAKTIEGEISRSVGIRSCNPWQKNDCVRIYINPDLGFFDCKSKDFTYHTGTHTLPDDTIRNIQKGLKEEFLEMPEEGVRSSLCDDGIEKRLSNMEIGDKQLIAIPFENNVIDEITEIVQRNTPMSMDNNVSSAKELVHKAAKQYKDANEFAKRLEKEVGKNNPGFRFSSQEFERIEQRFPWIRDREASMKAIYRLISIGVVSDYTIDYLADEISCEIVKKSDTQYKEDTAQYLRKYCANERVERIMSNLDYRSGESVIQKCVNLIIEFTYEQIAKQRRSAIEEMEQACKYGLEYPDNNAFEEYIMMYMNSKYARRQYLPTHTDNGNLEDMAIVNKYIDFIRDDPGGEINNLKHLRGAAALMHSQRPENYVFLLLDAFATFILEKGRNAMITKAFDEAMEGFERYAQENNLSQDELNSEINIFANKIAWFDEEAAQPVQTLKELLAHKQHLNWLKEYKNEKPYSLNGDII